MAETEANFPLLLEEGQEKKSIDFPLFASHGESL